jgi:uncharacterized RDD family membrane protein YckC
MSMTASRSTPADDASTLNFRPGVPMVGAMNAIAQASSVSGPQLDNRRVLAGVVDLIIVALGAAVVLFAGDALSGDRSEVQGALGAVILGWALYYYFALESGDGQTVGKKLMKLRVMRADGRPAGMREIAVRTVLRVVDAVTVYAALIVTGQRRQRIGDLAAGTIVVDASAPASVPAPAMNSFDVAELDQPEEEVGDELEDEPPADIELGQDSTATLTLPPRAQPPETLADIAGPEAPASEDEPVVAELEEPVVEDEPIVAELEEPVAEEAPVVEVEPAEEELLPEITSPSLEELARDVAAAHTEPEADVEPPADEESDEEVTVKSVETVSAIDLVMGGAPEEDSSDDAPEPA